MLVYADDTDNQRPDNNENRMWRNGSRNFLVWVLIIPWGCLWHMLWIRLDCMLSWSFDYFFFHGVSTGQYANCNSIYKELTRCGTPTSTSSSVMSKGKK
jgi:hypothetical protein